MIEKKKQPQTPEELEADIETHPERGKINGEEILALDRRDVRGTCSGESKRKLIRVMSVYGWDMSEGLSCAIAALWDKERENVEAHEREKAQYFEVSVEEIKTKQFGIYKDRGRRKKANLKYNAGTEG